MGIKRSHLALCVIEGKIIFIHMLQLFIGISYVKVAAATALTEYHREMDMLVGRFLTALDISVCCISNGCRKLICVHLCGGKSGGGINALLIYSVKSRDYYILGNFHAVFFKSLHCGDSHSVVCAYYSLRHFSSARNKIRNGLFCRHIPEISVAEHCFFVKFNIVMCKNTLESLNSFFGEGVALCACHKKQVGAFMLVYDVFHYRLKRPAVVVCYIRTAVVTAVKHYYGYFCGVCISYDSVGYPFALYSFGHNDKNIYNIEVNKMIDACLSL